MQALPPSRDQHIRIEWFAEGGSALRSKRLSMLGAATVAVLFGVIAVLSVRVVWDDYRFGETSPGIGVPQWWYSIWLPVFSASSPGAPWACSSAEAARGRWTDARHREPQSMIATLLFVAFWA